MPLVDHIDGPNRDIYLHSDTVGVEVHPIDVYKEMRTIRRTDETLRSYDVFLEAKGNEPKGGGKFTERYVVELGGTRIIPFDTSHTLVITGTIITDDGQSGIACFDRSPLTATTVVDIDYQPPQVEVIEVASGSGLDAGQDAKLTNIDDLLSNIEGTFDHRDAMRILLSAMAGKVSGAGTLEISFNDLADLKARIVATVDANGNRTGIILDAT